MQDNMGHRDLVEAIRAQLDCENDRTRWCAVKALGRLDARGALPELPTALRRDPDPDVRMEIAWVLGSWSRAEGIEALIEALNGDLDDDVRLQACRALGHMRDPRAEQALIDCLAVHDTWGLDDWDDGDDIGFSVAWEVQREALEGLARIGGEDATEATIQVLRIEDDDDLQRLGMRTLATLGGERATDFVIAQLKEGHRTARRQAAKALALAAQGSEATVMPHLLAALQDEDADVRIAAGWRLAGMAERAAPSALIRLLRDPDASVRGEAVRMVANVSGTEVVAPLIRLAYDPAPRVQQRAIEVLGERCESRAASNLLAILDRSRDDDVLANALVKALGCIKALEALAPLGQLLRDGGLPPTARVQAVFAFGDIAAEAIGQRQLQHQQHEHVPEPYPADIDPVVTLTDLVSDRDLQVGQAALIALSRIGGEQANAVLIDTLQEGVSEPACEAADTVSAAAFPTSTLDAIQSAGASETTPAADILSRRRQLRSCAAKLLIDLDIPQARPQLRQMAQCDDPELRCAALSTLMYREPVEESAAIVAQGLGDASRDVRIAALQRLGQLQPDGAADMLLERLAVESDPMVRPYLLEAIGRLGDRRATAHLIAALDDDDRHVQRAALAAIAHLADRTAIDTVRPMLFAHGGGLWREALTALQGLHDSALSAYVLKVLNQPEKEEDHWIAIEILAELLIHSEAISAVPA